jgi:hypothetical protein
VTNEGRQIAASIDEKLCVVEIVFLGEPMQERRVGLVPWRLNRVDFEQNLPVGVDRGVELLLITINLNLFLVGYDPRRQPSRVALCFRQRMYPVPDHPVRTIDTPISLRFRPSPDLQSQRVEMHPCF